MMAELRRDGLYNVLATVRIHDHAWFLSMTAVIKHYDTLLLREVQYVISNT